MSGLWFGVILLVIFVSRDCLSFRPSVDNTVHAVVDGDLMLGGLVAVHGPGVNETSENGIQRVEAMRYAIAQANKDWSDTDLRLGIKIRDTYGSETRALDESLQFLTDQVDTCNKNKTRPLFGVVGPSMSLLTKAVVNLLRLFHIPLISYASTSTELSDTTKYDYMLRTVPPDSQQSCAMVDFITEKLHWKSVIVIYSLGSYGEYGYDSFVEAVRKKNDTPCIVQAEKVKPGISEKDMENILEKLHKQFRDVLGIVCYCEIPDVETLIKAVKTSNVNFKLIGSDTTLSGIKTNNSIVFSLHYDNQSKQVRHFYDTWYSKLTPNHFQGENKSMNPWFETFWREQCVKSQNAVDCNNNNTTFGLCRRLVGTNISICQKDDKVPYLLDAVEAFSRAIREFYENNRYEILNKDAKDLNFFQDYLKEVQFKGATGEVHFNRSAMRGAYDINLYNVERQEFEVIGTWQGNLDMIPHYQALLKPFYESSCQHLCGVRQGKVYESNKCCWTCQECTKNEYLLNDRCTKCNNSQRATDTGCTDLLIVHYNITWKIIIGAFSLVGVCATLFTIKTFAANNDSPLVKSSGRELTYIHLVGILLLFCLPAVLIPHPTDLLCNISRFAFGTVLCLCYCTLLVKTNRIARIFSGRQDLYFLTPNWQLMLTAMLMMPQILILIIGFAYNPESMKIDYDINPVHGVEMCLPVTNDLIATIIYNMLLVFLCTFYAFRTRKAPSNFNEARDIAFVMYTTLVIWIAFLPVYFSSNKEFNTVFLLVDILMNGTTLLLGLFGMKMYILIFRPDKNTEKNSKLRAITVSTKDDVSEMNSPVTVRYKRSLTTSTLVSSYALNDGTTTNEDAELSFSKNCRHHKLNNKKLDRGTSTRNDSIISESFDEAFHEALHKTLTI